MTQSIFGLGLGGTGIVAVLIVAGILLNAFNVASWGTIAIGGGVVIGIVFGLLGIFGILSRFL